MLYHLLQQQQQEEQQRARCRSPGALADATAKALPSTAVPAAHRLAAASSSSSSAGSSSGLRTSVRGTIRMRPPFTAPWKQRSGKLQSGWALAMQVVHDHGSKSINLGHNRP